MSLESNTARSSVPYGNGWKAKFDVEYKRMWKEGLEVQMEVKVGPWFRIPIGSSITLVHYVSKPTLSSTQTAALQLLIVPKFE